MVVADATAGDLTPERLRRAMEEQRRQADHEEAVHKAWEELFPPVDLGEYRCVGGWFAMGRAAPFDDHERYGFTWVPSMGSWGFGHAPDRMRIAHIDGSVVVRLDDETVVRPPGRVHHRAGDLLLPGRPGKTLFRADGEAEWEGRRARTLVGHEPVRGDRPGRVFTILVDADTNLIVRWSSNEGAWADVRELSFFEDALSWAAELLSSSHAADVKFGTVTLHPGQRPDEPVHISWDLHIEGLPSISFEPESTSSASVDAAIEWARSVATSCRIWVDDPRGYQRVF